ncbi:ABC transporter, permease protein [Lactiplantibacillus plantarum]|nr:ABC transporter, permease protein [Lactiplantibacillus plantarum]
MNKKLGHLIIWQHAPLLIGMLILFIALGAWTGFRMNQHWQMLDQNHDMLISGLKYDHRRATVSGCRWLSSTFETAVLESIFTSLSC